MDRGSGKRLSRMNRKTAMISVRCREDEKRKIEQKADRMGISESKLIEEAIEVVLKRKTRSDKNKVKTLVEMQETMNQMVRDLGDEQDEYRMQLLGLMERTINLWEF